MLQLLRQTLVILVLLSAVMGILYPLVLTGIAQLAFPHQANGSLIHKDGQAVGSELIGQPFSDPKYFWTRPSATASTEDSTKAQPYNAANSGGSNLGPLNPALADNVKKQIQALNAANAASGGAVPVDLVTASGSGLDPHISPAAAEFQVARVAKARGLSEDAVRQRMADCTEPRQFGVLGEPRVNVLRLNISLDSLR
jgi:potassium-transporting ATPase KdpC subunit